MRTITKQSALAGLAAAAVALTAAPAAAAPSAAGLAVVDEGHVDVFGIAYEEGELHLHVHDDGTDTEHEPSEVLLAANPEARTTVPDDPAYEFLGEAGSTVWVLPDTHVEGVLFAGWATEEIAPGDFQDDTLSLTVHGAAGSGEIALYTVDDLGTPEILFDSDAGPGGWDVTAGGHGHLNWGFTEAGLYRLTVEAEGVLADTGESLSTGEVDYWFWVREQGTA